MTENTARRHHLLALLVAGTFFMENFDATVITTALPAMAHSFGVAPTRLSIGISAYLLTLAVLIPLSGWLADRVGPRKLFPLAIGIFTVASVLCGLSESLWFFTIARILQGIGGAMMVPVGRLVVLRRTEKSELVKAIAILTWPGLVAPILGPPLGGLISGWLSWHWIFFLNLPLGLIALALSLRLVRDGAQAAPRFDGVGFAWTALGSTAVMYAIELASHDDGSGIVAGALLLAGLLGCVLAARHLLHTAHPLLDLRVARIPTFAVTLVGGSLFRIAIGSAPFLLPLMFQLGFGMSGTHAGLLLLALFAGNLAMKPATSAVMRRFGFRPVLMVNGLLVAIGFALCALFTRDTPMAVIVAVLFFAGMTRSMQFTALNTIGFADVPRPQMNGATTLFSMFQQMNAGLGIAVGALALKLAPPLRGHAGGQPDVADFHIALVLVGLLALVALIDVWRLPHDAGAEVAGRQLKPETRPALRPGDTSRRRS
jgi:EmrB/QacA subfamily drug resistance transporter